ncbi:MAG: hypothetical protein ABSF22_27405 [Bryobacteraceae bacterium]|jgi:hypothetical protein
MHLLAVSSENKAGDRGLTTFVVPEVSTKKGATLSKKIRINGDLAAVYAVVRYPAQSFGVERRWGDAAGSLPLKRADRTR